MTKDGQTVPTANIPMGGFKLTGLGAGTSATDAAQFGQLQNAPVATLITVSGADTITGTLVQTLTAYATGQQFSFVAAGTNTTAVTLNIDGLGAKAVTRTGAVALAAGALVSGQMAIVEYDGTRFQLINANAFTNLTVSGALTVGTTLAVTGVATLTAQPILSSLTASLPVFTDASKGLVSNAMTGTGSVMMSASPTTTGTLTAAAINASGTVAMAGAATVGTTLGVTGTSTMAAINASGSVTLSGTSFFRSPTTSNTPGTFNFYLAASGIREGTAGDFNIDTYSGGWGARLTVSQAGAVTIPGTLGVSNAITVTNNDVILTGAGQFKLASTASAAGTTVVHNANGYYYDLLSSRRYKENFRAIPNDRAALDRFLKLTPGLFDLKNDLNDKNVINFYAEDAADAEKDGLLSLTNYNSDGAPQSLRDYGFSAYQQLVLQDHEARLAALQEEFQSYKNSHP